MMGCIEEALREKFFLAIFEGEEIISDFRKILIHSVKHIGLDTPDPIFQQIVHTTPKSRGFTEIGYVPESCVKLKKR